MSGKALEIRLLGELEVRRDGRVAELPASKKSRALLAYLVATGRPQLREKLCELLWEGPDDPRAALRWSLTKIRPALDSALLADRERVSFEARGATIDLGAVRELCGGGVAEAATESLRVAAERFRGDLLEGLDLPDCYRYQEWLVGERETVRALRIAILTTLVERLRREPEEALRWARARVAIDPLSEAAHAAVVRLLGELGRSREALKQYESCRRILDSELGTKPSHELERARMSVGQAKAEAPAPAPTPAAPTRSPTTLIGRRAERAALEQAAAAASVGKARGVLLLVGEPGIGKSRLLDEAQALVRSAGGVVLAGRAFEAEMVRPYGAWIDALRSVRLDGIDGALRADLAPLLPELAGGDAGPGDRNRLFDAVAQLLSRLGTSALVLDDLHWFDEASAALLHYVVRALGESRVLIACGARPGELADNRAALRLVRALVREGQLSQQTLLPLDAAETAELVRTLDGALDTTRIFADSDGNPLFALEIARSLAGGAGDALSGSLEGLIADRLARLDERARDLLPWAAALGHGFAPDLLAQVTGIAPGDLLAAVDDLERRSVLRVAGDAQCYDFAHDLIRQAAYRQLSEPRRRLVHLQIARSLAKLPDAGGALAGDLAHHAALGGDHELAARASLRAAERCWHLFANAEAVEAVDRGIAHLAHLPREIRVELNVALLRTKLFAVRDNWKRVAPSLDADISRAILEAQAAGHQSAIADGLFTLSGLHHDSQNFQRAEEFSLQAAEAARAADPKTLAQQLANTGRCLLQIEGDIGRARLMVGEAQILGARLGLGDPEIGWGAALVHYWDGDMDAAVKSLEDAYQLARELQDRWREYQNLEWLARIALERQRTDEARTRIRELTPVAEKMGGGSEEPFTRALAALVELQAGQSSALPRIEEAIASLGEVDSRLHLAYVHNFVALLALREGRHEQAQKHAQAALAAAQVVHRRSELAIARAVLAQTALGAGDAAAAREHLLPILPQMLDPNAICARARAIVGDAARALGLPVSTVAPTRPTTASS